MILKRIKKVRNKFKRLYLTMIKNYILFCILMMFVLIAYTFLINGIASKIYSYTGSNITHYRAVRVVKSDYRKIDIKDIKSSEGWVEILNEKGRIIYVKGEKKDKIEKYSLNFLINKVDNNYTTKKGYFYSFVAFHPYNNYKKNYYCVVKIPRERAYMALSFTRKASHTPKWRTTNFIFSCAVTALLFILLFISLLIYSSVTSKKIIRPLNNILKGIEQFKKQDYSVRLKFDAENEFAMIRDSFNEMAEHIENSKAEREKNERQKQQLLVDISHDLKTPITSIQGYSRALYDGVVEDEAKKARYLKIIYDKSQRVTLLIDDLHEFTKLENSMYVLHKEKADFAEFIRELVAGEYDSIEGKCFELDLDVPEYEIIYDFDSKEMSRAVLNIIANAVKYNPAGTKLNINLLEENNYIVLKIADNGVGISEELRENIFEPFTRGDVSRRTTGGTGLGLSITRKIIEKHGGSILLYSDLEYATVFEIKFKTASNI